MPQSRGLNISLWSQHPKEENRQFLALAPFPRKEDMLGQPLLEFPEHCGPLKKYLSLNLLVA